MAIDRLSFWRILQQNVDTFVGVGHSFRIFTFTPSLQPEISATQKKKKKQDASDDWLIHINLQRAKVRVRELKIWTYRTPDGVYVITKFGNLKTGRGVWLLEKRGLE